MSEGTAIRYVCVSDTHFGEEDSLLTCLRSDRYACDPRHASPTLQRIVAGIEQLVDAQPEAPKPILLLNGDILELAFASYSESLATFECFMQLVARPGHELFEKVVYIPGNHDHHVWEIARETQYVNLVLRHHHYEDGPPPPIHATPIKMDGTVRSFFLDPLMRHVRRVDDPKAPHDYPIHIAYPNLALEHPTKDRVVVVHHGHFMESLYYLMSALRRKLFPDEPDPETVAQVEGENWAWIDFVWSLLGRSGDMGLRAEVLYKRLQYPMNMKSFVADLARRVAESTNIPMVPGDWMEEKVLGLVFRRMAGKLGGERVRIGESDEKDFERGLQRWLFKHTYRQLEDELGGVPKELAYVYGHTHKPFHKMVEDPRGEMVEVYNSGGWAIDNADREPTRGGAIILISEDLQIVTLRVFHDGNDDSHIMVTACGPDAEPFRAEIERRITEGREVWDSAAETITREAAIRRDHIRRLFANG